MKKSKKNVASKVLAILGIILLILIVGALFAANWYNSAIYNPASSSDSDITFVVNDGDTLISILPKLQQSGLVTNDTAVKIYLRLQNISPVIKTGTYTISSKVNVPQLIDQLGKGVFKASVLITIKEGLRDDQIADLIAASFVGAGDQVKYSKDDFLNITKNPDSITFSNDVQLFLNKFRPSGKPLTGFLFPDTYRFDVDASAQIIIETLVSNFQKRIEENNINTTGNSTLASFYQELSLASIVEKEASKSDDSALIAGIFYNRLKQDYPLQADSTINFITGKNDAGALITDTKIDSPFNTYLYPGVTPTPIDNPGIKSISAAVAPETTDYFFFLHDKDGVSHFAVTFEEHQANIAQYLQ